MARDEKGFPLNTTLKNRDEISAFCRRDWRVIRRLIAEEGFPATKDGKLWVSDMILIQNWQRSRIEKACQQ